MSRNPFDDVGQPRGGTPQPFHVAAASVQERVEVAVKKVQDALPPVPPDLITGEEYTRLEPESIELVQQHVLDDVRFEHTEYKHLITLPTHQERERAAKALYRRDDSIVTDVDMIVDDLERQLSIRRREGHVLGAYTLFAAIVCIFSFAEGMPLIHVAFNTFCGWWAAALIHRVQSMFIGIGGVSGRAV
jgi:hypothetical protein